MCVSGDCAPCGFRQAARQQRSAKKMLLIRQRASQARRAKMAPLLAWAKAPPSSGASYTALHPSGHWTQTAAKQRAMTVLMAPQATHLLRWCSWRGSCRAVGKKRQGRLAFLRLWGKQLGLWVGALSCSCSRPSRYGLLDAFLIGLWW